MAKLEVVPKQPDLWAQLRAAAEDAAREEPRLASQLNAVVLAHEDFAGALSFQIARKLGDAELGAMTVREVALSAFAADPGIVAAAEADLKAVQERDPAIRSLLQPFMYFKGFQALQAWRVAHWLWTQDRDTLAFHFQSRISELFQVDIHPAARVGAGVFIDHGTGVVIGETAIIGDRVRLYQMVTLGAKRFPPGENGELKKGLARHPLIEDDVVIYAGATILGRVTIGKGSTIGGNVWLTRSVPPGSNVTQASLVSDMPDCGLGG